MNQGRGFQLLAWLLVTLLSFSISFKAANAQEQSPVGEGKVARAVFTSGIVDREPVDQVLVLDNDRNEIYFFSELKFLQGRTIIHRWEYNGQVVAEVPFKVGGPRWRVFSKKTVLPEQTGEWTVVVVDEESGWPLLAEIFRYEAAQ